MSDKGDIEDEARFIALLEAEHRFPTDFKVKVICVGEAVVEALPEHILRATGVPQGGAGPQLRSSSGGRYVSATFFLRVQTAPEVLAVYRALRGFPGVLSYF